MNYPKLQHTKKQHTVPKVFLKNFSDNKRDIYRIFKKPNRSREIIEKEINSPVSLETATVVDNFYTVKSGKEPMMVETLIYSQFIENEYPQIYKVFVDPNIDKFDMKQRSQILTFFATLHCRTPKQFELFFNLIPPTHLYELEQIKEDYKSFHLAEIAQKVIEAHQFKRLIIYKITDNLEFITSDNPVLIVGRDNSLKNNNYREQFNRDNICIIPIDRKHCCVFSHCKDKNGIDAYGKLFYNKIERKDITPSHVHYINYLMLGSGEKYFYGSKKHLGAIYKFHHAAK
ncbi:MAG: DUF4238 domain-containing protein [Bacteroidota bacterium]|nr:DUF4238 domain-containing protein [Bacteroidota bacterium]